MKDITGPATLLRIFIGELDKYHHQPLYEAIVLFAKRFGLAGANSIARASVLRGKQYNPLGQIVCLVGRFTHYC